MNSPDQRSGHLGDASMMEFQKRCVEEMNGLHRYFSKVVARLNYNWVEQDYEIFQLLTKHGCSRKRNKSRRCDEAGAQVSNATREMTTEDFEAATVRHGCHDTNVLPP
ncbi:hypothetical protein EVAR_16446_1 [Eumeta japonica]|uniref:Uncharacterized protein n=1 Tax=Eumeta variegata TaxID=151549 RepID=A0A4C1ULL5_EUMVA|nr:hypothetical protein EVAR_16446_1 [Eumeta japonica]